MIEIPGLREFAWSRDGSGIAVASRLAGSAQLALLHAEGGAPIWANDLDNETGIGLAMSNDGTSIALPTMSTIRVFNTGTGQLAVELTDPNEAFCAAGSSTVYTPGDESILSARIGTRSGIAVWDLGRRICGGRFLDPGGTVLSLGFTSDGSVLLTSVAFEETGLAEVAAWQYPSKKKLCSWPGSRFAVNSIRNTVVIVEEDKIEEYHLTT